jgi:hypothetical protein
MTAARSVRLRKVAFICFLVVAGKESLAAWVQYKAWALNEI